MELYYKDFISRENSLGELVDDLMLVVQGADELVRATGGSLSGDAREEIHTRLQRLKDNCAKARKRAAVGAAAADKFIHEYPYSALGFTFALGVILGAISCRDKKLTRCERTAHRDETRA
jgi:ElaB/YqjD/DUF883 family membrane-anchored ribosome-binding protein